MTEPAFPTIDALDGAARAGTPLVVGQLGTSLDGRVATPSGHSHYINGRAGLEILHRLRAHVDAVIVGAGTAVADNPQLTVRLVDGRNPARVLIDPSRRGGSDLRMLSATDDAARLVIGPPRPGDPPNLVHLPVPAERPIPPEAILDALASRGFSRILVEGGAHTVSHFLAAGHLSRLCITVAPILIGSGPTGLNLPEIIRVDEAIRPTTTLVPLSDGDVLFDCEITR